MSTKKHISGWLFLLAVLTAGTTFAQQKNASRQSLEKIVCNDFAKLNPEQLDELVPFYLNGYWGYLSRSSMTVVVPARYSKLAFFNPTMDDGEYRGVGFNVYSDGDVIMEEEEWLSDFYLDFIMGSFWRFKI